MNLLIKNGRVVDPSRKLDSVMDVLIRNGRIENTGKKLDAPRNVSVFDASDLIVAPGFIDIHTHLREPGQEHKETIRTGTLAAVAGGFTAVCAMANTEPVNDERSVTEMILAEAARSGSCRVYPIGAVSRGLRGEELAEHADLRKSGCVAVSDDGMPIANALLMRRALEYTKMIGIPVIAHEEDLDLTEDGVMHEGFVSTVLGLRGIPAASEETMSWRDVILTAATGGHLHLAHVSTIGALDAVRHAKSRGVKVTCEVTPHHLGLSDEELRSYSTSFKMKPPLRSTEHIDALIEAIADGTVDAIATDHAPHHRDEKDVEFDLAPFGIIGLETAFAVACDVLLHGGHVELGRLIELFTSGPAAVFSLPGGNLEEGGPADVTIVDPDAEVTFDSFRSKSKNSPWTGRTLRGRVEATVVGGEIRFSREERTNRSSAAPRKGAAGRKKR